MQTNSLKVYLEISLRQKMLLDSVKLVYEVFRVVLKVFICLIFLTNVCVSLQAGYTILGEVWSRDDTLEGGDWQLRLVGSTPHLPTRKNATPVATTGDELPAAITITPSLHTHEVIDYYLPDKEKKFLRLIRNLLHN